MNIIPDVPGGDALDTKLFVSQQWNEEAPDFYKKMGFEIYGEIENYPEGYKQFFLLKRL